MNLRAGHRRLPMAPHAQVPPTPQSSLVHTLNRSSGCGGCGGVMCEPWGFLLSKTDLVWAPTGSQEKVYFIPFPSS